MPRFRLSPRASALTAIAVLAFAFAFVVHQSGPNQAAHFALVRALASGTAEIDPHETIDAAYVDGQLLRREGAGARPVHRALVRRAPRRRPPVGAARHRCGIHPEGLGAQPVRRRPAGGRPAAADRARRRAGVPGLRHGDGRAPRRRDDAAPVRDALLRSRAVRGARVRRLRPAPPGARRPAPVVARRRGGAPGGARGGGRVPARPRRARARRIRGGARRAAAAGCFLHRRASSSASSRSWRSTPGRSGRRSGSATRTRSSSRSERESRPSGRTTTASTGWVCPTRARRSRSSSRRRDC